MASEAHVIDLYVSSISSSVKLRQAHDAARRCLRGANVKFKEHDIASDEAAKAIWKRKASNTTDLPLILVDGERPGSIEQLEEAVEFGETSQFLGLDKSRSTRGDALEGLTDEDANRLIAEMDSKERAEASATREATDAEIK